MVKQLSAQLADLSVRAEQPKMLRPQHRGKHMTKLSHSGNRHALLLRRPSKS